MVETTGAIDLLISALAEAREILEGEDEPRDDSPAPEARVDSRVTCPRD